MMSDTPPSPAPDARTTEDSAPAPASRSLRLDLIDVLRGLALAAMVVFHSAWDLSTFDLISTDIGNHQGWQAFAKTIAASFLTITGVSLVLAHGNGFRRDSFMRRWLMVAGAALLVTLGTRIAFPDAYVFFGILHHIALASLLALPFLTLPVWAAAVAALLALTLPMVLALPVPGRVWLVWTGLTSIVPDSVDFVPLFPWFGCVLGGVAIAKLTSGSLSTLKWQAADPVTKLVALAGRNSLLVYIVHQPILLGLIWLATQLLPVTGSVETMARFEVDCRKACIASAKGSVERERLEPVCLRACGCARLAAAEEPALVAGIASGRLNAEQTHRLNEISQVCARENGS
jgi:uncharacterized membrane protein